MSCVSSALIEKNIQHPSPIQEEEDNVNDAQMLDDAPIVASDGDTTQCAPLASANNFLDDHWIKPGEEIMHPSLPAIASEDDIWFSPLPPIYKLSHSSDMQSGPGPSAHHPLSNDQMEAMLAQIHIDMEALYTWDRMEINF